MADPRNIVYEVGMRDQAVLKHEKAQQEARMAGRESVVHPYNGLVSKILAQSEKVLAERLKPRAGIPTTGVLALRQCKLPLRKVCGIAARTVVDGISAGHRLQTITERVGTRIEDEVRMKEFKRREPALFKWMGERFKERGSEDYRHKRQVLVAALRRANSDEEWETWETRTKAGLGLLILDAIIQGGFIRKVTKPTGRPGRVHIMVQLTEEAEKGLTAADALAHELLQPWYKPMLEPPAPWVTPEDGGYMTVDLPIMKTRKRQDIERLRAADMPVVYSALNAIQGTAWKINEDVLVAAEELRKAETPVEGLPVLAELERPVRPILPSVGVDLDDEQKELLSDFKAKRRDWFNSEAQRRSKTTQSLQILGIADELRAEDAVYFPHQLDYRGRAYAVPLQLNPQGNDLAKGLLTFSEGRPLGPMGGYWLAVHGANTFGQDKGPLNGRVDWVLNNESLIKECADDPLSQGWWIDADGGKKPWQFLAFCLEWGRYMDEGESEDFISYLPVAMDGSCNGLQHFSAMLRDEVGAKATNLTADGEQHDIYQDVADQTQWLVGAIARETAVNREMAGIWTNVGISRKTVKRPVMTTPYGVSAIGMKQMVIDDTIKADKTGAYFGPKPWETADWLAKRIFDAIGGTVKAAKEAMNFLQVLAKELGKDGQPISWVSPAGLPIVQHILRSSSFTIDTALMGRIQLHFAETLNSLDVRRQASSIAPNFVHSYDAAHLMLTVDAANREAERQLSWAMVHDSYGTHAGDVQLMSRVLRRVFVEMYQDIDPLEELRERAVESLPEGVELPNSPEKGTFDLNEVLRAEFFFA